MRRVMIIAKSLMDKGHRGLAIELITILAKPAKKKGIQAPPDAKPDLDRYFAKCKDSPKAKKMGTKDSDRYCATIAWSIFCKYKKPGHSSCTKSADKYFAGRGKV